MIVKLKLGPRVNLNVSSMNYTFLPVAAPVEGGVIEYNPNDLTWLQSPIEPLNQQYETEWSSKCRIILCVPLQKSEKSAGPLQGRINVNSRLFDSPVLGRDNLQQRLDLQQQLNSTTHEYNTSHVPPAFLSLVSQSTGNNPFEPERTLYDFNTEKTNDAETKPVREMSYRGEETSNTETVNRGWASDTELNKPNREVERTGLGVPRPFRGVLRSSRAVDFLPTEIDPRLLGHSAQSSRAIQSTQRTPAIQNTSKQTRNQWDEANTALAVQLATQQVVQDIANNNFDISPSRNRNTSGLNVDMTNLTPPRGLHIDGYPQRDTLLPPDLVQEDIIRGYPNHLRGETLLGLIENGITPTEIERVFGMPNILKANTLIKRVAAARRERVAAQARQQAVSNQGTGTNLGQ